MQTAKTPPDTSSEVFDQYQDYNITSIGKV